MKQINQIDGKMRDNVDTQRGIRRHGLWGEGSINHLTGSVMLIKVILTKKGKSKTTYTKTSVQCCWADLMQTTSNIAITLFVFSGLVIHHARQKHFFPPRVFLNCYCVCFGKRDERRHICLSLIWVAKRLLIPWSGDDFPNKSLPKHMPARCISALMENIMGK